MTVMAAAGSAMNGMGGMKRVDFSLHSALTAWQNGPFALLVLVGVIMAAYWYLRADWMLSARGRRWPWTRTAAFLAGLAAVDLALQSPIATFTGMYFQAHVVQHLMLMVVAPPLLALGAPSTLLLQTARRQTKERWLRILRSPAAAVITHPITVWCLYFGLMFAFFLSSLINVAMHHMALMDLLNLLFLFGGTLYWWPMVGLDPIVHWKMGYGARMVNILLGGPPEVILGLAILSLRVPIASMYTLSSTHAGGALLWISTEFVVIAAFMPIFWQWMRSDERAAARLDAQLPQGSVPAAPAPVASGPLPSKPAASAPVQPAVRKPAPTSAPDPAAAPASGSRGLTLWEAAWLARTGRIPIAGADSRWAPGTNQPASNPDD
jgi:putative membrane protein